MTSACDDPLPHLALPGIDKRVTAFIDRVEDLADPAVLDLVNDRLGAMCRRCHLHSRPKLDSHGFNDPRGCKVSCQGILGLPALLRAEGTPWPAGFVTLFDELDDLRVEVASALEEVVRLKGLHEQRQSVRAIGYHPGTHDPQITHTDPSVLSVIVLPPHDDHLVVETPTGPHTVRCGVHATGFILHGARAHLYGSGIDAVPHRVKPLSRPARRDVLTVFFG